MHDNTIDNVGGAIYCQPPDVTAYVTRQHQSETARTGARGGGGSEKAYYSKRAGLNHAKVAMQTANV